MANKKKGQQLVPMGTASGKERLQPSSGALVSTSPKETLSQRLKRKAYEEIRSASGSIEATQRYVAHLTGQDQDAPATLEDPEEVPTDNLLNAYDTLIQATAACQRAVNMGNLKTQEKREETNSSLLIQIRLYESTLFQRGSNYLRLGEKYFYGLNTLEQPLKALEQPRQAMNSLKKARHIFYSLSRLDNPEHYTSYLASTRALIALCGEKMHHKVPMYPSELVDYGEHLLSGLDGIPHDPAKALIVFYEAKAKLDEAEEKLDTPTHYAIIDDLILRTKESVRGRPIERTEDQIVREEAVKLLKTLDPGTGSTPTSLYENELSKGLVDLLSFFKTGQQSTLTQAHQHFISALTQLRKLAEGRQTKEEQQTTVEKKHLLHRWIRRAEQNTQSLSNATVKSLEEELEAEDTPSTTTTEEKLEAEDTPSTTTEEKLEAGDTPSTTYGNILSKLQSKLQFGLPVADAKTIPPLTLNHVPNERTLLHKSSLMQSMMQSMYKLTQSGMNTASSVFNHYFDRFLFKTIKYSEGVVRSCPSYFDPTYTSTKLLNRNSSIVWSPGPESDRSFYEALSNSSIVLWSPKPGNNMSSAALNGPSSVVNTTTPLSLT